MRYLEHIFKFLIFKTQYIVPMFGLCQEFQHPLGSDGRTGGVGVTTADDVGVTTAGGVGVKTAGGLGVMTAGGVGVKTAGGV